MLGSYFILFSRNPVTFSDFLDESANKILKWFWSQKFTEKSHEKNGRYHLRSIHFSMNSLFSKKQYLLFSFYKVKNIWYVWKLSFHFLNFWQKYLLILSVLEFRFLRKYPYWLTWTNFVNISLPEVLRFG